MISNTENALLFLLNTLLGLYSAVLILRVLLQWVRADFYNPISQFIWQVTNTPIELLKFIPRWRRLEISAVLLAWIIVMINLQLAVSILNSNFGPGTLLIAGLVNLVVLVINIYTISILVQAILSWVGQGVHSPATSLLWSLNEPLLRPVRQYLPPIGGLDLSPLFVIIGLQVVRRLLPVNLVLY